MILFLGFGYLGYCFDSNVSVSEFDMNLDVVDGVV